MLQFLLLVFCWGVQGECPVRDLTRNSSVGGVISINATQYTQELDCRWLITSQQSCPNGSPIINIAWNFVDTEPVKDQIVIYDGASRDARVLQLVSGTRLESSVNSSSSSLFIVFTTDADNVNETGFSFNYSFICGPPVPKVAECRPATQPSLLSVGTRNVSVILEFSDEHASYQDCYWVVSNDMPNCTRPYLEAEFTNFSALFPYDYLELYDGSTKNVSAQIGRYQGTKIYYGPGTQTSAGKQMLLMFHNEYAHPGTEWTGFRAKFTAKCNQEPGANCPLRTEPRVFDQQGYMVFSPAHYRTAENCYWILSNTNTSCKEPVVLMIFPVFRTTELYDTLTLWNGVIPGAPGQEIGKWSGSAFDAVPLGFQRSSGSKVLMEFHSGSQYSDDYNRGFTVQFAFPCGEDLPQADEKQCPPYFGVTNYSVQEVSKTAPRYVNFTASSYRNNLDCGWIFSTSPSATCTKGKPVVQLEFLRFATESNFDFLNIYDGPLQRTGDVLPYEDYYLLGSYSGVATWEIPTVVRSAEKSIMVTFHSDGTVSETGEDGHEDGFLIRVTSVCSEDPKPTLINYDCRGDNEIVYASFWTNVTLQNPRISYGHRYLPFSLNYPFIIEQYFSNANNLSLLSLRKTGVQGPIVVGYDKPHAGASVSTWTCCDELAPTVNATGAIVACVRGDCLFVEKIRVAQRAGAVGVIVVDTSETGVRMGSTVDVSDLVIPSVSTVASVGALILNTTARATLFASLQAFVCPQGTYSPTTAVVETFSPTPPPSIFRAPTPPTPPTIAPKNSSLFLTLPLDIAAFTETTRDQFMVSLNAFFGWLPGTARISSFAVDPDAVGELVAELELPAPLAEAAVTRWGYASANDKLLLSPPVLSLSRHEPHGRCLPVDCQASNLRHAEWDMVKCTCSHSITGAGVFVYVILPLLLCFALVLFACCCCATCPLYNRWKRDRHEKVAMEDMAAHDIKMMPRGVKDSEESMRGEGVPEGEDTLENSEWRGERTIKFGGPRSDESDEEGDTARAY